MDTMGGEAMTTKTKTGNRARDLMSADVVRLDPSTPIERAIEILDENEISGAPVTDGDGRLLGVLSARDVTRTEHVRSGRIEANRGDFSMSEPFGDGEEDEGNEDVVLGREDFSSAVAGSDTVGDWMNRHVVIVDPDASVRQVCRRMYEEHVHRVIVAKEGKVEGIITTFDVVRWIAERSAP
jgi:CBS domain-containing protein